MFLMISDILVVNLAATVAFLIRFAGQLPEYNWHAYIGVAPWLSLATVVLMGAYELYDGTWMPRAELSRKMVPVAFLLGVMAVVFSFLVGRAGFPRSIFVLASLLNWPALVGSRLLWQAALMGSKTTRIALVSERPNPDPPPGLAEMFIRPRLLAVRPQDLSQVQGFDVLVLDESVTAEAKTAVLHHGLVHGIPCLWHPTIHETLVSHASLTNVGGVPYFVIDRPLNAWGRGTAKRVLDVVLSALLLVAALPLMGAIALAILVDDGRPVIYRQDRVARQRRTFSILKFRTLVANYETLYGAGLTPIDSPAVTRVGRWLRATHLDELPQLVNVLRGDMSLVGPRPERPELVREFAERIPSYDLRHEIRPGLTGVAQLHGDYLSSPVDKLHMDLAYVRRSTIWIDLKLILQTVEHVLRRSGSGTKRPLADGVPPHPGEDPRRKLRP